MARKLTPKQEAFRIAYLNKKNGREAYRLAYDAEKMSDAAIDSEVQKLLKHELLGPMITLGLERASERIQIQADARGLLTLEAHMERLDFLGKAAEAEGKYDAAIKAEVKRGELRRFYIKQVETGDVGEFSHMPDEQLDDVVKQLEKELGLSTRH